MAVDDGGALAAQRLGEQRHRVVAHRQRRGVELDELEVGEPRAGARRHSEPVAGGLDRVGGARIDAAEAAGGEDDGLSRGTA